jgi:sulfate/thiosulfate transport system ATP-binding protein
VTIEVRGATKRYGTFTALDEVSITVPSGGLTALLGPSGGGKSTLLRVIAGLTEPDAGTVLIDGVDVTRTQARNRGIGFVFQHYAAFKHMTVFENIAFGLRVRKEQKAVIAERVEELLTLVHLDGFAHRRPSQLSGGQRQRMALARALAIQPKVLLLDEPFGALDAKVRGELREWLRELHDRMHVTTVFVTHDQEEAMELAEQIVLVNQGRIEQVGTPDQVYDQPANPFVMGFVGAVTRIGDQLVRPHDIELANTPVEASEQAMVNRVIRLGFSCRVELQLSDGQRATVQTTRAQVDQLDLKVGDIVFIRALRGQRFTDPQTAGPEPELVAVSSGDAGLR